MPAPDGRVAAAPRSGRQAPAKDQCRATTYGDVGAAGGRTQRVEEGVVVG